MPLVLPIPPQVAAALPISPGLFMTGMVLSAAAYAIIIVFNFLSLKNKSTHKLCVASVMILLAGLLVATASVGLTFESDSSDLLATLPGKFAVAILVLAALTGLAGFVHCYWNRGRFRRGRKRALGSCVVSLLAIFVLFAVSNSSKRPRTPAAPKARVALLPDTDAYGRPIPTPAPATPFPATPAPSTPPPATPQPLASPTRIATPTPTRLLPNVVVP